MKLIFTLVLRELKRNKLKVCLATLIVLILYMSAFTLCNVASALPYNFYRYYEELAPEIVGMKISNADKTLYDNKDRYFNDVDVDWSYVLYDYKLTTDDDREFDCYYTDEEDGSKIQIYNSGLVNVQHFTSDKIDWSPYMQGGRPWTNTSENGVWISSSTATALGVNISLDSKSAVQINFVIGSKQTKVTVNGVFDETKLYDFIKNEYGYNQLPYMLLMHEEQARDISFDLNLPFEMYGYIAKVDNVFNVYHKLSTTYNVDASVMFEMIDKVKGAEIICGIIGAFLLVGGVVILLNFINMFMSSNIKDIGLLKLLGAKTKDIILAYYIIFLLIITVVCIISWSTLPLYNMFVAMYCTSIGYPFVISINYTLVLCLFLASYVFITALMGIRYWSLSRMTPYEIVKEED